MFDRIVFCTTRKTLWSLTLVWFDFWTAGNSFFLWNILLEFYRNSSFLEWTLTHDWWWNEPEHARMQIAWNPTFTCDFSIYIYIQSTRIDHHHYIYMKTFCFYNQLESLGQPPGMVPMPVGEHHSIHLFKIFGHFFPNKSLGHWVCQKTWLNFAPSLSPL